MSHTITVDVDVSLDDFDIDDIADYLRENGYYVSETTKPADKTRYPQTRDISKYIPEFCKLNGLVLKEEHGKA